MECHPYMEDVFLVGTKNAILGFDVRVDTLFPIRTYFSQCEEVSKLYKFVFKSYYKYSSISLVV